MMRAIRNSWVRTGVMLGAITLAYALAFVIPAAAAPLGQAGTGTVTGQILSADNVALPNARLAAYAEPPSTPNRTKLSEFQSDAQGRYSVQVPAGQVWIQVETQDIMGRSFWGYDSLPLDVAAGQTVSGQDFHVAIRVVSEPKGLPSTGAGPDLRLPLVGGLGLLMLLFGLVQRRRAPR